MRYLAIARFRFLTMIRSSTPIFIICMLPAAIALGIQSKPEPLFRAAAETLLSSNATAAFLAWVAHGILLSMVTIASGRVKRPDDAPILSALPDLMDTAPVMPETRFWGEALGTLGVTAVIHACCLPLLAAAAALSPLPNSVFASAEAAIVALMILASAGAAWQRRSPWTKFGGTRGLRSAIIFAILLLLIARYTTRWEPFRDSLLAFVTGPSMQIWRDVAAAVENPLLLVLLSSLIYAAYIYYYYASATRKTARA